ncbi:MlaD family protein [Nocardia sp. alder85J]|uniref:MlaD family protein n=1 Tax=Nocardia sp. alder85J TaxID=2862949 RepID=UPI001CD2BFFA|nr:MlaD family protein [Nocardia sp. alder85J]MCX4095389.1 MlaD family protein [Nocardia sp. alder85J]
MPSRSLRRPLLGVGAFALAGILATGLIWDTLAHEMPGDTVEHTAVFTDVLGLRVRDDIRIAGVRVGRVDRIGLARESGRPVARVTFRLQRAQRLPADTKALIRFQDLLGRRYIALTAGSDPRPLPPGAEIPLARTEPSYDLSALLTGFRPLFATLTARQVNALADTLIRALQGDGVALGALISETAALATDFQRRDVVLTELIESLSAVMSGLARHGDELATLAAQTRTLVDGLYRQGRELESAMLRIADDTATAVAAVAGVRPRLASTQLLVRDTLTLVLANGAALDRAAVDLPNLLADGGRAAGTGAYASSYICFLDVSLYGVLLPRGVAGRVGGSAQSAPCRP